MPFRGKLNDYPVHHSQETDDDRSRRKVRIGGPDAPITRRIMAEVATRYRLAYPATDFPDATANVVEGKVTRFTP